MHDPDERDSTHPQRDQTDESLRVEREKADIVAEEKRDAVDAEADGVVRLARERADEITAAARAGADGGGDAGERARADRLLRRERSAADAALDTERAARRRYLTDFLAAERDATDQDLLAERAHADTAVDARDDFLATVTHDLRALLGGLALNATMLVDEAPEGEGGEALRVCASRSQRLVARMNRLVNDLIDVASIEAGKLALFPEQVLVARALADTLEAFEPLAAAKRISLDAAAADPSLLAWIDEGRVLQVLANVVGNAIKFTPSGGRVSVSASADGREVHFTVTDSGIGIPEDAREGVFERFRQVRRDPRGLGLGLHISKSIVEAHGGRIWLESHLGAGSTFHFALPAGADGRMNDRVEPPGPSAPQAAP